jgi:hypothetical protein
MSTFPGEISALQAMQRLFRITPSDLKVTANDATASAVIDHSGADSQITALVNRLKSTGYEVGTANARKVEVPINHNRPEESHPVVDLVSYELRKEAKRIGYVHHAWGPQGGLVLARARRSDGSIEVFFDQKGKTEHAVFDHKGLIVSATTNLQSTMVPAAVSCKDVCNLICQKGAGSTIAECAAACLAGGPEDEPLCDPLCAILVTLGCLVGCDKICSLCC